MTAAAPGGEPTGVPAHPLRVAYVWNEALQAEDLFEAPNPVVLGAGRDALFDLPAGTVMDDKLVVLKPSGQGGYSLIVHPKMGGDVWKRGVRTPVTQAAPPGAELDLGPNDYGVITLGPIALFFQHVRAAPTAPRKVFDLDTGFFAALMLSAFVATLFFVLMLILWPRAFGSGRGDLELSEDLLTEFLVTPPPEFEEQVQPESGTNTEDPGLRSRDETGGERHEGEEGRVGREDATQEDTEIEGEQRTEIAQRVRNQGLLGALSGGGEENAIAAALDVPEIGDILGGTGAVRTIAGRGSGGAGLRGVGPGGGGDGPGSLFGAGNVGTGIGTGRGGLGRGRGGIGAKGRPRAERAISVQRGTPNVSGYLSPEQINRVVRANSAAIRYCYEVEVQRQPNLRGRVAVAWRINLQGAVTSARIANSTLRNAGVEGCIVRQVRRWRFPQPDGGEVQVTYPFIFGVQGG